MSQEEKKVEEKKGSGCAIAFLIAVVIAVGILVALGFIQNSSFFSNTTSKGGVNGSSSSSNLFSRSANSNDILVDYDFGLTSIKGTISPQVDINNLEITIELLDSNQSYLSTVVKQIGNVKKGVQVSFSISVSEIGLSVAMKTSYTRLRVSGGTVSYFA